MNVHKMRIRLTPTQVAEVIDALDAAIHFHRTFLMHDDYDAHPNTGRLARATHRRLAQARSKFVKAVNRTRHGR